MSWARFDDRYHDNPKVNAAWFREPAAIGLHVMCITYCAMHETDGLLPIGFLEGKCGTKARYRKISTVLFESGLLEPVDENWVRVHDFLEFNPSKAALKERREWDKTRKALYSDHALIAAIRDRDQDLCRYCGTVVSWTDRRGPTGGTYDHVIPRGPATLENIVVACRRCNTKKNNRTPEQANMPLLPPRSGLDHGTSSDLVTELNGSRSLTRVGTRPHPDPSRPGGIQE